ncbi:carbonic anhydrase [Sphaerisporangium krabiense]|uniref:Carbonic anhydrase n=1 Tax=Sphaerisporangium krabiense TaxID=763782 RepID=A0A7W9DR69_9ACTN|nr:carbonic anhydrase [Sphaerisporangium krabiense]MBB5628342.1 carbonic anhydrase [Sphaerisporangium krabiense]GII66341.1 carbonic anhydrase [Sphaerisporangium krabiense]
MQSLIDHARMFHRKVSGGREQAAPLKDGISPQAMFITCSDAHVIPSLITGARPGELFELRTAGNIIPPYRLGRLTAEAATIEYAVNILGVRDLVVCGHTRCGAVQGRVRSWTLRSAPTTRWWLLQTHRWREARVSGGEEPGRGHLIAQLDKLRRYPRVARRVASGRLRLHGWFYDVDTGVVSNFQPETGAFTPL